MANVSLKNLHNAFTMNLDFFPPVAAVESPTFWGFVTNEHYGEMTGSNLTYDSQLNPQSGTVTKVGLDIGANGGATEFVVTGLNVDFGRFNHTYIPDGDELDYFWAAILEGNDTVDLGANATTESFTIKFAADGRWATTFGGNDTIRGDAGAGYVMGDLSYVKAGFTRYGGNDDIRVTKSLNVTLIGDAGQVQGQATLVAGNDYLVLALAGHAYGDAEDVFGHVSGGNDTITGSAGGDFLVGDVKNMKNNTSLRGGDDLIKGGGGNDYIYGDVATLGNGVVLKGGNDMLYGDSGEDNIEGGGGNDTLYGGSSDDVLIGEAGNDQLRGDSGDDLVYGDLGNDSLYGGSNDDWLSGDGGNDWLRGEGNKDTIHGGAGTDTADYGDKTLKVTITFATTGNTAVKVNNVVEDSLNGIENVVGGTAGDDIRGSTAVVNNFFNGGNGSDILYGGGGNDTLVGGAGNDLLRGDAGNDQFRFTLAPSATNKDTIADFDPRADLIALDDAVFTELGTSVTSDEFVAKASGHVANNQNQHLIYDNSNGTLWFDRDGNKANGVVAVQIAQLGTTASHTTALTFADFVMI